MLLPPLWKSIGLVCLSSHVTNFPFDFILIKHFISVQIFRLLAHAFAW
jgi:hypothetical protein